MSTVTPTAPAAARLLLEFVTPASPPAAAGLILGFLGPTPLPATTGLIVRFLGSSPLPTSTGLLIRFLGPTPPPTTGLLIGFLGPTPPAATGLFNRFFGPPPPPATGLRFEPRHKVRKRIPSTLRSGVIRWPERLLGGAMPRRGCGPGGRRGCQRKPWGRGWRRGRFNPSRFRAWFRTQFGWQLGGPVSRYRRGIRRTGEVTHPIVAVLRRMARPGAATAVLRRSFEGPETGVTLAFSIRIPVAPSAPGMFRRLGRLGLLCGCPMTARRSRWQPLAVGRDRLPFGYARLGPGFARLRLLWLWLCRGRGRLWLCRGLGRLRYRLGLPGRRRLRPNWLGNRLGSWLRNRLCRRAVSWFGCRRGRCVLRPGHLRRRCGLLMHRGGRSGRQ